MRRSSRSNAFRKNPVARNLLLIVALLHCGAMVSPAQVQQNSAVPKTGNLELAISYNAAYAGQANGNQFWLSGGNAELAGHFYRGLSVIANITGLHTAHTGAGVPLNLLFATFGPRYSWRVARRAPTAHSVSIFGEGLVGEAHGFGGLFPAPGGANSVASSLALQAGGGLDIPLAQHLSLRALQASWLRTQLPNTTTNVQNNLQLGIGIVFHSAAR